MELFKEWWAVGSGVAFMLGGIMTWGLRLEGRQKVLRRDVDDIKERQAEDRRIAAAQRKEDLEATNRSRNEMRSALLEVQNDIKQLLMRVTS